MALTRVACVGAVVRDDRGRLLLVRRGTEPAKGRWSVPGGRIEPGETAVHAVVRELAEETGLRVIVTGRAGTVERTGPDGMVYEIEDFYARLEPGVDPERVRAGDDAAEAGWFTHSDVEELDCVDGLLDTLRGWQVIPAQRSQGSVRSSSAR
jgi:ADP-ribose pyrophosphatase YjhB (NUDIX family)